MEIVVRKPKYLVRAELAQERKEQKYKKVLESEEFAEYLLRRKLYKKSDLPAEDLYKLFLKAQCKMRYNHKIRDIAANQDI